MKKRVDIIDGGMVVFDDYPTNKYAKKIDWWTSDKGIQLIRGWRQTGASIKDIYEHIGVDVRTFRSWRKKCPQLEEALVFGKEITNANVVDALYKRAVGFYYYEETEELVEGQMMLTKRTKKYCPPDTKAILSWLFNRSSDLWRAVQEPVDTNMPAIANAEQVLVRIREAGEGIPRATGGPEAQGPGPTYPQDEAGHGGPQDGPRKETPEEA